MARSAQAPNGSFEQLGLLHQLTLEAGLSQTRQQLVFRILNRTIQLVPYDRAVLWDLSQRGPRLLGVSGEASTQAQSVLCEEWRAAVQALPETDQPVVTAVESLASEHPAWQQLAERFNQLHVLWVPLPGRHGRAAGLWLERWDGPAWTGAEAKQLGGLALGYGIAWRQFERSGRLLAKLRGRGGKVIAAFLLAMLLMLTLVRLPLRVVAPCEVVPREPVSVTTPLVGEIDAVFVKPGQRVEAGARLASYDRDAFEKERKEAARRVEVVAERLQRVRVEAHDDPALRSQLRILAKRLAQETIRLERADDRLRDCTIHAPASGSVTRLDPTAWPGRTVEVGERLLTLVEPGRSKLRFWIPERDNIPFDQTRPVRVVLVFDPRTARRARIRFVATQSRISPAGFPAFAAEADWIDAAADLKFGLKGTAVVYGRERVCLGYWLLRKPWASLRVWLGF